MKNVAGESSKMVEPEEEKKTSTEKFTNVDDESGGKNEVASAQEKEKPTGMQHENIVEAEESGSGKIEEIKNDIHESCEVHQNLETKGDLKNPVEESQESFPENVKQENEKKDGKVNFENSKDQELKNAENKEQGKRNTLEKNDRSSTASMKGWEAEVVIDATGRSKSKSEGIKIGKEILLCFQCSIKI